MRFVRVIWVVALAISLVIGVTGRAAARQDGLCDAPHRSLAELGGVLAERGAGQPLPDPVPYAAPDGTPADGDTAAAIRATVQAMVACGNGGDIVGLLSLFTDAFLQRHFTLDDINAVPDGRYQPTPVPTADRFTLDDVRDVRLTGDGRAAALVVFSRADPAPEGPTHLFAFVKADGRWLIDAVQPVTLPAPPEVEWQPVAGAGYAGVIVPQAEAPDFALMFTGAVVQGAWTPTSDQIAALEAALPGFLRGSFAPAIADKLGEYGRQYAGYVADGRALILVNAFCDAFGGDWRSRPVFVADGGDCFFSVVWDPTAAAFERLLVNGEA